MTLKITKVFLTFEENTFSVEDKWRDEIGEIWYNPETNEYSYLQLGEYKAMNQDELLQLTTKLMHLNSEKDWESDKYA